MNANQAPEPGVNVYPQAFAPAGHRTAPLSLSEMKSVIDRGESVMWRGRVIESHAHLPTEAQLAVGDPVKEAAAADTLQAQIDKMNAELAALKSGQLLPAQSAPASGQPAHEIHGTHGGPATLTSVLSEKDAAEIKAAQDQAREKAAQRAALLNQQPKDVDGGVKTEV